MLLAVMVCGVLLLLSLSNKEGERAWTILDRLCGFDLFAALCFTLVRFAKRRRLISTMILFFGLLAGVHLYLRGVRNDESFVV